MRILFGYFVGIISDRAEYAVKSTVILTVFQWMLKDAPGMPFNQLTDFMVLLYVYRCQWMVIWCQERNRAHEIVV
jgi:hypothetical protein